MANTRIPSPYSYRGRWRAHVTLKNGKRPWAEFQTHDEAKQWIADQIKDSDSEHEPRLGGPKEATLATALDYYARIYTVNKGGAKAELNRINHYLESAGQPCLQLVVDSKGAKSVEVRGPRRAIKAFDAHNESRREARAATYRRIATLATRPCSRIATADIREMMADMGREGLTASTIQKEVALLKHLFNMAANEWNWVGFKNPCHGIKLGKSNQRFVFLSQDDRSRLWEAIAECDNPFFGPLVGIACETVLRRASLLALPWTKVDLDGRLVNTTSKSGDVTIPLTLPAVEIFRAMPRSDTGRVFPITEDAVDQAWDGVRRKAGLPTLQFKDLRHVGATDFARRGLTAPQLARVLGHKSLAMAQVYINLVASDITEALDRTQPAHTVYTVAPLEAASPQEHVRQRRSARLARALAERIASESSPKADLLPMSSASLAPTAPDRSLTQLPTKLEEAAVTSGTSSGAVVYHVEFGGRKAG